MGGFDSVSFVVGGEWYAGFVVAGRDVEGVPVGLVAEPGGEGE